MERSSQIDFLQATLDTVNAQNERLIEENAQLRRELQRLATDERSKSTINVEAKLKAFQMEGERDRMYEQLEKVKRKYAQLHEAFLEKVKRCKALEDVFNRQKTLNGLVMKSDLAQRLKEQNVLSEKRKSEYVEKSNLEEQVSKLQMQLDEAYDVIDELEFELESIDLLEMENQRLQEELKALRKDKQITLRTCSAEQDEPEDSEAPPVYSASEGADRFQTFSNASSLAESFAGDMDPAAMERAALTDSLIRMAEAESNCLRRELLRSRLRRTVRGARPTSSDA